MILAASTIEHISAPSSLTPELKLIIEQPLILAQRNMIYHALQMMVCMVDIPADLVIFLVTGDWII